MCPGQSRAVTQLREEVWKPPSRGEGHGWWAPHGRCRLTQEWRGQVGGRRGFFPQQKAPWETALSPLLSFFPSLARPDSRNSAWIKLKTRQEPGEVPGILPDLQSLGFRGFSQGGFMSLCYQPSTPHPSQKRKLCVGFKTNFICWNPTD